jgi:hypothetical protein
MVLPTAHAARSAVMARRLVARGRPRRGVDGADGVVENSGWCEYAGFRSAPDDKVRLASRDLIVT